MAKARMRDREKEKEVENTKKQCEKPLMIIIYPMVGNKILVCVCVCHLSMRSCCRCRRRRQTHKRIVMNTFLLFFSSFRLFFVRLMLFMPFAILIYLYFFLSSLKLPQNYFIVTDYLFGRETVIFILILHANIL